MDGGFWVGDGAGSGTALRRNWNRSEKLRNLENLREDLVRTISDPPAPSSCTSSSRDRTGTESDVVGNPLGAWCKPNDLVVPIVTSTSRALDGTTGALTAWRWFRSIPDLNALSCGGGGDGGNGGGESDCDCGWGDGPGTLFVVLKLGTKFVPSCESLRVKGGRVWEVDSPDAEGRFCRVRGKCT